ncbi:uncharacterized mitochondrial protein-like protein [Tanacetum coccineum]
MVQRVVLMKYGLVSVNTARQVNVAHTRTTVNTTKNSNQKVNTVRGNNVNSARPKAVVNAVKGNHINAVKASTCWVWKPKTKVLDHGNPQQDLQEKGVAPKEGKSQAENSVLFNDTECIVLSPNFKLTDESHVLLKVPGKKNMYDNKTEFKNKEMNQFCKRKGIKREFSVARTPQQNGVAERKNKTLIEAARTMLADSKLPTTFWDEAVNIACYFSEDTPNVVGSGPDWLFDIDALTRTMNYEPIVAGTQSNGFASTKPSDNACQARKETKPVKNHILLPLWPADPPFSQDLKKKDDNVNNNNNVNAASTNEVNDVGGKISIDPNITALEDINIFDLSRDNEDVGVEADINNLDITIQVNPILTKRIHKDHPLNQRMSSSAFLYGKFEEEVLICQHTGFEDPDFSDKVYKKKDGIFISQDKYVGEILKKFGFIEVKTASTPIETQKPLLKDEDVYVHIYQVNLKVSHLHAVKRIFRYLKGQPKLGLWYLKDSPFDLVAYTDSDYAGASLDRKSTTGGCQFLRCRLISWQCKKQTVVANSITEAEYVAASSCLGQPIGWEEIIITEASVRSDLQLDDEEGTDCLPNATIFKELIRMSTMTSTIICLATNQKFNFSKYIFESIVKNLENVSGKFLMYPRPRKPKRKDTEIPQSSVPSDNVTDKAVNEEMDDSLERAAITAY